MRRGLLGAVGGDEVGPGQKQLRISRAIAAAIVGSDMSCDMPPLAHGLLVGQSRDIVDA